MAKGFGMKCRVRFHRSPKYCGLMQPKPVTRTLMMRLQTDIEWVNVIDNRKAVFSCQLSELKKALDLRATPRFMVTLSKAI